MREAYSVQTIETCVPVAEYLRTCVDVEKFLGFCRECGNYGRRWSCPPFEFDPLELWNRYDTLHLYPVCSSPRRERTPTGCSAA